MEVHLGETEDVVNEEQHILPLCIAEMFCHCKPCTVTLFCQQGLQNLSKMTY